MCILLYSFAVYSIYCTMYTVYSICYVYILCIVSAMYTYCVYSVEGHGLTVVCSIWELCRTPEYEVTLLS